MLRILFYVCVFTLSLGQLGVIGKGSGVSVYLFDVFICTLVLISLIYFLAKKIRIILPRSSILFLMFTLWATFVNILKLPGLAPEDAGVSLSYFIRWFIYLCVGILVYNMFNERILHDDDIDNSLLISGLFLVAAGILQLIFIPDFEQANLTLLGWDPHKNRLASTFLDPNFLGAYLNIIIFWLLHKSIGKGLSVWQYFVLGISFLGVVLTFSRSAWLMLGIGIFLFALLRRPLWLILGVVIASLAYYAVPRIQTRISGTTDPADSAQFRLESWQNAWDIYIDNAVLGVGFNAYRYVQKGYGYLTPDTQDSHSGAGADSSILFVLATTGTLGGMLYLSGLAGLALGTVGIFLPVLITGLLVDSLFINSLFYPQIMFWMLVMGFKSRVSHT